MLEIYQAMKQMTNIHEGRQRVKLNSDVKSFLSRSQNFSPKRKTGKAERPAIQAYMVEDFALIVLAFSRQCTILLCPHSLPLELTNPSKIDSIP